MPLQFQYGDITTLAVDAIVNAANEKLLPGGGVCGAIFQAAGPHLEQACSKFGGCPVGQAVITPGFSLPANYIIHTVGPVWQGGSQGEAEKLASCYQESIKLAQQMGCNSIAFPLISSGIFGYPPAKALQIAVQAIHEALKEQDINVTLIFHTRMSFVLEPDVKDPAAAFMKDRALSMAFEDTTYRHTYRMIRRAGFGHMPGVDMPLEGRDQVQHGLTPDETFAQMLARMMQELGMDQQELRWKANMSAGRLDSILKGQMPSKAQALALAIAMKQNLSHTRQLLATARLFLDATEDQDLLAEYCICEEQFDVLLANQLLFAMGQPQLIW